MTYTLRSDGDAVSYEIEGATGQLTVAPGVTLDHEIDEPNIDTVTVRATDPTDRYSEVTVTINITDVDENPTVTIGSASHDLPENSHEPAPTLTLGSPYIATDPEDDDDDLIWSVSGRDRARFVIPNGQLSFKEAPNYEVPWRSGSNLAQRNTYNLTVVATDSAGHTGTMEVTVVVRNFQEPGTITLSNRGARVGTSLTATLNEPDGVSGRVTWTWTDSATSTERTGSTSNKFTPHAGYGSGNLFIMASYNDREADTQTASANVDSVQANTNPATTPVWGTGGEGVSSVEATVTENAEPGAVTYTATAVDSGDGILTYSLSGSDSSAFTINPANGALTTRSSFDREKKSTYNVSINVKNRANKSDNLSVRVNVGNEDESPVFTSGATSTEYAEGSSSLRVGSKQNEYTYAATDPEKETVTLTLVGDDAEDFNFQNGILSFKVAPDYEVPIDTDTDNEYTVTITASDGTISTPLTVTITVMNVDEDGEVSLDAIKPKSDVSLAATLSDADGDLANQEWTWSRSTSRTGPWITSTGTGATSTVGSNTAAYTPNESDVGSYIRATVVYTDGQTEPATATKTAEVISTKKARDVDYANTAPLFPGQDPDVELNNDNARPTNATTSREIAENSPAGTNVGARVMADDLDESREQQVLTYAMADTTDGSGHSTNFEIGRGTGQITVANNVTLNHETQPTDGYEVTVTATDPSGLISSSEVTIMLTDLQEDPKIDEVAENANLDATSTPESMATTSLSSYTATDDDEEDEGLKWSLSGADEAMFSLCDSEDTTTACGDVNAEDSSSNIVYLWFKPSDYEKPSDSGRNYVYDVIVTVTDNSSDKKTDTRPVAQ